MVGTVTTKDCFIMGNLRLGRNLHKRTGKASLVPQTLSSPPASLGLASSHRLRLKDCRIPGSTGGTYMVYITICWDSCPTIQMKRLHSESPRMLSRAKLREWSSMECCKSSSGFPEFPILYRIGNSSFEICLGNKYFNALPNE
jgi:hypothetical protein